MNAPNLHRLYPSSSLLFSFFTDIEDYSEIDWFCKICCSCKVMRVTAISAFVKSASLLKISKGVCKHLLQKPSPSYKKTAYELTHAELYLCGCCLYKPWPKMTRCCISEAFSSSVLVLGAWCHYLNTDLFLLKLIHGHSEYPSDSRSITVCATKTKIPKRNYLQDTFIKASAQKWKGKSSVGSGSRQHFTLYESGGRECILKPDAGIMFKCLALWPILPSKPHLLNLKDPQPSR